MNLDIEARFTEKVAYTCSIEINAPKSDYFVHCMHIFNIFMKRVTNHSGTPYMPKEIRKDKAFLYIFLIVYFCYERFQIAKK